MSICDLAEDQEVWALNMLCRSGVLKPCVSHEGVYVEQGNDVDCTYKYGTTVFNNDRDKLPFDDLAEARDSIKLAYDVYSGNDYCPLCHKYMDD